MLFSENNAVFTEPDDQQKEVSFLDILVFGAGFLFGNCMKSGVVHGLLFGLCLTTLGMLCRIKRLRKCKGFVDGVAYQISQGPLKVTCIGWSHPGVS